VPQVAVTLMLLCMPGAGLLQFGAADQDTLVGVSPFSQVKAGGVIAVAVPIIITLSGTEPQVSRATDNVPLQLAAKPLTEPQVAVTLMSLYAP